MSKRRFSIRLLTLLFLITGVFGYVYMEEIVDYVRVHRIKSDEGPLNSYLEVVDKTHVYVRDQRIFTLSKQNFRAVDYEGNEVYKRVLPTEQYRLMGAGDFLFLMDNEKGDMLVLDTENHLLREFENMAAVNGVRSLGKGFVLFSEDGVNFVTTIYDEDLQEVLNFSSKNATVDVVQDKGAFKVLGLERTEGGLSTYLTRVDKTKNTELLLDLKGYIPLRLQTTKEGDLVATDKELIFLRDNEIEATISYEKFHGLEKLDKHFLLFADQTMKILDSIGKVIHEETLPGFDQMCSMGKKALLYSGRIFYVVGDEGIERKEQTDRDILRMYGEQRPIVEFKNGFTIY